MMKLSQMFIVVIAAYGWATSDAYAAPSGSADISVREAAGIRRNAYPVDGHVAIARGVLTDPLRVRLMFNEREIAAQVGVESRWPDNSIRGLDIDFNASIGPLERQTYRVEFGNDVTRAVSANGLSVTQTADAI